MDGGEESLRPRYRIYVCPQCGEQFQYAGFCEWCNRRLGAYCCIPVEQVLRVRDEFVANSSYIPGYFIRQFVDRLLSSSGSSSAGPG